jgi:glycosyltransferase involved in cell wall biosynthesis
VLFMGRIHPIKGADKLLEAFIRIASREPNARLVLAGPNEFGLEASFISHVNSSGLSERVIFPGMVSGVLKTTLLNRANLFVLPSSAEGFSMAILEALAHKTAVLISPRCFFPEVEKVGAGRIIEPTVSNLESTMSALLTNPARLTTMGLAGYELVSKQYSWRSIASQMVDAYLEGIARFRTRYR